jgi:hypothetical protein
MKINGRLARIEKQMPPQTFEELFYKAIAGAFDEEEPTFAPSWQRSLQIVAQAIGVSVASLAGPLPPDKADLLAKFLAARHPHFIEISQPSIEALGRIVTRRRRPPE